MFTSIIHHYLADYPAALYEEGRRAQHIKIVKTTSCSRDMARQSRKAAQKPPVFGIQAAVTRVSRLVGTRSDRPSLNKGKSYPLLLDSHSCKSLRSLNLTWKFVTEPLKFDDVDCPRTLCIVYKAVLASLYPVCCHILHLSRLCSILLHRE